ncbi:unnamed protein product [Caenorhabditis bovis]|uniref:Prolyl 4-hydroxylase alpha subunit domain-containing protein n=1 Tax=Caenorhabditis bovis TaxID=2654633 RepID=A0A8S1FEP8_9PELO|nr:unnamed protein product [Caenorhabditis bovis]
MTVGKKRKSSQSSQKAKRRSVVLELCHISNEYQTKTFTEAFRHQYIHSEPFPHWQLRNFIDNSSNFVEKIETELQNFGEWKRKENDLYSLYQTDDLKSICPVKYPNLYTFRQFLYTEVREWLQKTSGVELTEQVDCNGSCYAQTDGLLPHNDLIDTRRFAFVYYLTTPNWNAGQFGGALQLFNSDKNANPTTVAKELLPLRNSFMIFEVSEKSWHRVAEMLGEEPRLSINGWFHSKRIIEPKKPRPETVPKFKPSTKFAISNLINPQYMQKEKQDQIQATFADSSELNLVEFLKNDFNSELYSELSNNSKFFKIIGPPSKRHIARLNSSNNTNLKTCSNFIEALKSKNFASLAEKITGVTLKGLECSLKISRIENGSYWVIGDEDAEQSASEGYSLDINIFVQKSNWPEEAGGNLVYIAEDEEEELLHISPQPNCASVIFREPGVLYFLKYANHYAKDPFFLFTLSFHNVEC